MSVVPESRYVDNVEVSDILTSPTSVMVRILLLTELVLLTSVLSVTVISRHNTILNAVAQ